MQLDPSAVNQQCLLVQRERVIVGIDANHQLYWSTDRAQGRLPPRRGFVITAFEGEVFTTPNTQEIADYLTFIRELYHHVNN